MPDASQHSGHEGFSDPRCWQMLDSKGTAECKSSAAWQHQPSPAHILHSVLIPCGAIVLQEAMGEEVIDSMRMYEPHNPYNTRYTDLMYASFDEAEHGLSGMRYVFIHILQKYPHLQHKLDPFLEAEVAAAMAARKEMAEEDGGGLGDIADAEQSTLKNAVQTALAK